MGSEPIGPCPFCRGRCEIKAYCDGSVVVKCLYCGYTSARNCDAKLAIDAHNIVSRASIEYDKAREGEVRVVKDTEGGQKT